MKTDILIKLLREQIAKPTVSVVNSESVFVRQKLFNLGEQQLSILYWNWVCGSKNPGFGEEVIALQQELNKIDAKNRMPEWGYKGT